MSQGERIMKEITDLQRKVKYHLQIKKTIAQRPVLGESKYLIIVLYVIYTHKYMIQNELINAFICNLYSNTNF